MEMERCNVFPNSDTALPRLYVSHCGTCLFPRLISNLQCLVYFSWHAKLGKMPIAIQHARTRSPFSLSGIGHPYFSTGSWSQPKQPGGPFRLLRLKPYSCTTFSRLFPQAQASRAAMSVPQQTTWLLLLSCHAHPYRALKGLEKPSLPRLCKPELTSQQEDRPRCVPYDSPLEGQPM